MQKQNNYGGTIRSSCPLDYSNMLYKCDQEYVSGSALLGITEDGRLHDSYKRYTEYPGSYKRNKRGDVIIPIRSDSGVTEKIAIVESSVCLMRVLRLYEIPDDVYDRDRVIDAIICGEVSDGTIPSGLGVNTYILSKTKHKSDFNCTGEPKTDSFRNHGFGFSYMDFVER